MSTLSLSLSLSLLPEGCCQLEFQIHNNTTTTLPDWQLHFDLPKALVATAGTEIVSRVGNHIVVRPAGGGELGAGTSATLHVCGDAACIQRNSDLPAGTFLSVGSQVFMASLDRHNLVAFLAASSRHSKHARLPCTSIPQGGAAPASCVLPRPQNVRLGGGVLNLGGGLSIQAEGCAQRATDRLSAELSPGLLHDTGIPLKFSCDASYAHEAYAVRIDQREITIVAKDEAGFFYAAITLLQLIDQHGARGCLPCLEINDTPRFGHRGLMLDCARHFHELPTIFAVLELMARFKLNRFHWHLCDDEAWRLEIKTFPALTEVGAWRGHTETLAPQFGSGPLRYGGWYSQDDVRRVIDFAGNLEITVIPEIDVPGHARAAIRALPGLLEEVDDRSTYLSVQFYRDNVLNPALDGSYEVLFAVLDEVCALFPGPCVHLGGDEVPDGVWQQSPACRALMAQCGYTDSSDLMAHLMSRLQEHLGTHGKRMMGWEEASCGGRLQRSALLCAWSRPEAAQALLDDGYDVIACPAPQAYLDLAWDAHIDEPGYYWAGNNDLQSCFNYQPPEAGGDARVLGIQALLWSELIRDRAAIDYMLLPRLLAMAETAWTAAELKDWEDFTARLPTHLATLQHLGYRGRDWR